MNSSSSASTNPTTPERNTTGFMPPSTNAHFITESAQTLACMGAIRRGASANVFEADSGRIHPRRSYPIGRSNFFLSAVMIRPKRQVRAELNISGEQAKAFLASLKTPT